MAPQPSPILFASTSVYFTKTMPPVVALSGTLRGIPRCSTPNSVANILNA